ncbi:MAG: response regulator [Candidatus Latescibacteria bacterium]|nr:response regulator [Candidatus Latescibacterota bacterium]
MESERDILWIDDEIDLLQSHIIFLSERGYRVTPVSNGDDAVALVRKRSFDIILLDEMMSGRDGLSTLAELHEINPNIPVVMITKSEAEELMEDAIGQRIDDFLIKPVNPSQILSTCKRILDAKHIREDRIGRDYVSEFNRIRALLSGPLHWRDWIDIHGHLSEWDLETERFRDAGLREMHRDHRRECDLEFGIYIERMYRSWLREEDPPPLSVDVLSEFVVPHLTAGKQVFFIVVDCLRLDHWLAIEPLLAEFFTIRRDYHYSILPTATPYSRNAIFSGLFPGELAKQYPKLWQSGQNDERSLNRHEHQLMDRQLERMGLKSVSPTRYVKVLDVAEGRSLVRRIHSFASIPLTAVVFNFIDILAHGRSESDILQEIAPNEAAFRSLTLSWFKHSSLFEMLRRVSETDAVVVLTTDHGSVLGTRATIARGNRGTSTNLRYKYGSNLNCDRRQALLIRDPSEYKLPSMGMSTNFIIAKEDFYFVYPTKFHEYERQYRDSFQHGGISLEEMVLPVVVMKGKG